MDCPARREEHGISSQSLAQLADQVNDAHRLAEHSFRNGIDHALKCGEALTAAKQQVAHGQWLAWLERNCPGLSVRTAQGYMRLALHAPELSSNTQPVSHLGIRDALELLAEPREVAPEVPARIPETERQVSSDDTSNSNSSGNSTVLPVATPKIAGPLPGPGERLQGVYAGALITLRSSADPGFVFVDITYVQTGLPVDGETTSQNRAVSREYAHLVLSVMLKGDGMPAYNPSEIDWADPEPWEVPEGTVHPDCRHLPIQETCG